MPASGGTVMRRGQNPLRRTRPYPWNPDFLVLRKMAQRLPLRIAQHTGTLLDIGSGDSPYAAAIRAGRTIAVDVERGNGVTLLADAHRLPLVPDAVDMVVSFQVLEHLKDPPRAINEVERVLRPGGIVVMTTHGIWPYHGHDYHRWTHEGLALLFADFIDVRVEPLNGPVGVSTQLLAHGLRQLALEARSTWVRLALRTAVAAVIAVSNAASLVIEESLASVPAYRRVARHMTDVYIITAQKAL